MILRHQQVAAIAIQRGGLEREGRIDINNQIAVGGKFGHFNAIQPVRQTRHPVFAPVLRQRVFQTGDRQLIQREFLVTAVPVAFGADQTVDPTRTELRQGDALWRRPGSQSDR